MSRRVQRFPKELEVWVRAAMDCGWTLENGGKHPKLRKKGHRPLALPSSPGDWRSMKNTIAQMKRMGVTLR